MKEFRNPENVHQPVAGYTHQVEIRGFERLLILSGQIGMKKDGSVPGDPIEQLEVAIDNLIRNLHAANIYVAALASPIYKVELDAWATREDGTEDSRPL